MLYNINGFILKLPVDHKCGIRHSFAAFLLLSPLFFSEFLVSNDKGMAARAYIGREDPVAPGVGDRPLSPLGWATGPSPGQGPLCKFQKKYIRVLSPVAWATGPLSPPRAAGVVLKYFKTDIYF